MELLARWLDTAGTAAYLHVQPDTLRRLVKQGRVPRPSYHLGPRSPRWDRHQLDAAFDSSASSTNVAVAVQAGVQEILKASRTRRPVRPQGRN
jgi:hypothetical protein